MEKMKDVRVPKLCFDLMCIFIKECTCSKQDRCKCITCNKNNKNPREISCVKTKKLTMPFQWCLQRWRFWIRPVTMITYGIIIIIVLPLCSIRLKKKGASPNDQAWLSGGIFVLMALPITFWEITQHLVHYTKHYLQKHIIRILWMVPIYALNAWLALTFPQSGIYLDTCRECYEAYVIYNFMIFLLNFLHFEMGLDEVLELKPHQYHLFPLCWLSPCPGGRAFIQACKHGILQYTVIRPLTTITSLICELAGVYGEGKFSAKFAFPYILAVNNVSQFIAMYCLVLFYKAYRDELAPMKPVAKFLCIKAVVFFSFFQSVIITILVYVGVISESFTTQDSKDVGLVSRSLQDFLICIEMFLASVAHYFAFSHIPFIDLAAEQVPCCMSFMSMWDVSDVTHDVSEHIRHVGKTVRKSVSRKQLESSIEEKQLLVNPAENTGIFGRYDSFDSCPSPEMKDDPTSEQNAHNAEADDLVDLSPELGQQNR